MNLRVNSFQTYTNYNQMIRNTDTVYDNQDFNNTKRLANDLMNAKQENVEPGKKTFIGGLENDNDPFAMYGVEKTKSKEKHVIKKLKYNPNEIANAIMRAKTSASAAGTVSKAKRKISELKRKLASKDGDTSEIQIALTHARSMERVAVKKKRHLELEELIKNTIDDKDSLKENVTGDGYRVESLENTRDVLSDEYHKEIEQFYDKVDAFISDFNETMDCSKNIEDSIIQNLNDVISEYSREFDDMLSEVFDVLELVDLDMSKEDFKMLKLKHESSERKDIVRANMEYLKSMFRYYNSDSNVNSTSLDSPVTTPPVNSDMSAVNSGVSINLTI